MNVEVSLAIIIAAIAAFGMVAMVALGAFKQDPVSCRYSTIVRDGVASVRCYNDATGRRVGI